MFVLVSHIHVVRGGRVSLDSFPGFISDDPLIRQLFVPSVV